MRGRRGEGADRAARCAIAEHRLEGCQCPSLRGKRPYGVAAGDRGGAGGDAASADGAEILEQVPRPAGHLRRGHDVVAVSHHTADRGDAAPAGQRVKQ
jgi:hypothetical protein